MKWFLLIIFYLCSSLSLFASCREAARANGDGVSIVDMVQECFLIAKSNGKEIFSDNKEIKLYGYENMLFVDFSDPLKYQARPAKNQIAIAGSEIGFDLFEDGLILDKKNQLIILSNGKISVFRMNVGGNVAPVLSFENDLLRDASLIEKSGKKEFKVSFKGSVLKRYFKYEKKKIIYTGQSFD